MICTYLRQSRKSSVLIGNWETRENWSITGIKFRTAKLIMSHTSILQKWNYNLSHTETPFNPKWWTINAPLVRCSVASNPNYYVVDLWEEKPRGALNQTSNALPFYNWLWCILNGACWWMMVVSGSASSWILMILLVLFKVISNILNFFS